ncbi:V-type proton ATPase subunit C 2 isoform X3 [Bos indicus]|uniref:V-type proton ATPase subunit C n=1 Tax=Bos indicus TaxID=9915 RepID=A0ABM4T5A7_BOSIN|nr:V-type proton ATPase subunit C 2 isoform X3 [Bos indicus x Bos taurus]XP_061289306.1 V-type proton ATPase subunit C 2 isoform X3 [Bos javanicus]
MSEFWLISAPRDKENLQALERMNTVTSKSNLSYNTKFTIPDFKVGTLDSLVGLSDELAKLDVFAESLIRRMAQSVVEVMEDSKGKVQENLLANGGLKEKMKCLKIDLTSFVTHFEWDVAKYPAKQPLVSVVDILAKQLAQIEIDLKSRTAAYNTLKTNLENLEKKSMGNLFTRTLSDIVSKEDFVLDSEYLITLLVIVPKPSYVQWQKTYESLSDMVVPRSTKLIAEDKEGGLFTVTLFRKVIDDFKTKAKENKFTVREFYYDEKEIKREREEMTRLLSDKKQQYGPLLRWLKVHFSEAFVAWIHIKALRVFVESVLRYGLPVNFQAVLLQPHKKSCTKRLRQVLNSVFRHLDEVAAASILDASVEIPGLQLSNQDYFPYVYFHIDLSLLD